jgi:hypothetical protein
MKRIILNAVMGAPLLTAALCLGAICCCAGRQQTDEEALPGCGKCANRTSSRAAQSPSPNCQPTKLPHVFQQDGVLTCDMQAGLSKWNGDPQFIMQWDDTKKKLVFNGCAIPHACGAMKITTARKTVCGLTKFSGDTKDEYSFETPSTEELCGDRAADRSVGQDGNMRYAIEWDEEGGRYLINGLPIEYPRLVFAIGETYAICNAQDRYQAEGPVNSFNSPLDRCPPWQSWNYR